MNGPLHLTERPYPVNSLAGGSSHPNFPDLLATVRQLKAVGIPRSRLYYLYESLFASLVDTEVAATIATKEVVGRLSNKEARKCFIDFLQRFSLKPPPWRRTDGDTLRTPILDLVEIWDFVPE